MSILRKTLLVFLSMLMVFFAATPASATSTNNDCKCAVSSATIYESQTKNKVLEIKEKEKKYFVVMFAPVTYHDLSDKKLLSKAQSTEEMIGERAYFRYVDNVSEAKRYADIVNTSKTEIQSESVISPEATYEFWNDSYIETWWSLANGSGFHLHLSDRDASYVTTVASTVSATLATTLLGFTSITRPAAAVIGGAVSVAVVTLSFTARNADGSLDLYSPNKDRWDSNCVSGDQYLGSFRMKGEWFNLWYKSGWSSYCL